MAKPTIFDGKQHREMTDAEYAQWQADNVNRQAQAQALEVKAALKANALAKLNLTADEVQALFG